MVIILLETCGHYFDRGSSKKRLDQFLIHFQRYVLSKGHLPLDIEFDLQENIEQRKLELRGRPPLNMTIPMSVFEGSGKDHHHFIGENGEEWRAKGSSSEGRKQTTNKTDADPE
ncbi:hypothetical protein HID58_063179 [Brassica napus]|uniref:MIF4G domain-containing protein n=2 Tax=Brassica TaxID=3705 RepID=A0ABQ8A3S9_BRANA|nr:hypothetical protein HID58_063179 [Brassica napus]